MAVREFYRTRAQYYTLKLNRLNQLAMRLEKAASTLEKSLKEARGTILKLHGHTAYERAVQKKESKELRGKLLKLWGEMAYNRMLLKRQAGGEA